MGRLILVTTFGPTGLYLMWEHILHDRTSAITTEAVQFFTIPVDGICAVVGNSHIN